MGSRRLFGKTLHVVRQKPLLQYLIESLQRCRLLDGFVVATSTMKQDDPIADHCAATATPCFRGAHLDVAGRFCEALRHHECDCFVRVCGDSPLLDHRLVDRAVEAFVSQPCDVLSNVFPRRYPSGQSVEVVKTATFVESYPQMRTAAHREHVTTYFYEHPERYNIRGLPAPEEACDVRLAVDTAEDMAVVTAVIERMEGPHWQYDWLEIARMCRQVLDQRCGANPARDSSPWTDCESASSV